MPGQPLELLTFAERLDALMREQEIGLERLGRETGISPRLISKYRKGRTVPRDAFGEPSRNALKLARALGVSLADLLPPDEEQAA